MVLRRYPSMKSKESAPHPGRAHRLGLPKNCPLPRNPDPPCGHPPPPGVEDDGEINSKRSHLKLGELAGHARPPHPAAVAARVRPVRKRRIHPEKPKPCPRRHCSRWHTHRTPCRDTPRCPSRSDRTPPGRPFLRSVDWQFEVGDQRFPGAPGTRHDYTSSRSKFTNRFKLVLCPCIF